MTTTGPLKSPFANLLGIVIEQWEPGFARVRLPDREDSYNMAGAIAGGAIASIVDIAATLAGYHGVDGNTRVVTLSLSVNFVAPALDAPLFAHGRKSGGGAKVYMSTVEVRDAGDRLIASGQGTFKLVTPRT